MLSVLPRDMEQIRASQSVMLAREEMFEKKGSLLQLLVVLRGVVKKSKTEGDVDKVIKESPKPTTKEGVSRKK